MIVTPPPICRQQALKVTGFCALKVAPWMAGAAECQVEQDFEVTPVGGFAALIVGRSPDPESSAADQDGAPTTATLSGPVTLTAIISAGRTVLGSDAGVESLRHSIDGRFANLELEKMVGETF